MRPATLGAVLVHLTLVASAPGCAGAPASQTGPTPVGYDNTASPQKDDGPTKVSQGDAQLSEFCAHQACESYDMYRQKLQRECLHAYAGPCAEFFVITYPTYPVEDTRYYDPTGALIGVRSHLAERSARGRSYGVIPACASRAEKVPTPDGCRSGPPKQAPKNTQE